MEHRSRKKADAEKAPYAQLDQNIIELCRALNSFTGIRTIGSCGGHENPASYQLPAGAWHVLFRVEHDDDGWYALEFLA